MAVYRILPRLYISSVSFFIRLTIIFLKFFKQHQICSLRKCYRNTRIMFPRSEAATRGVLCEKVFLEISQNPQEKTCARVSFLINFIRKGTWHGCFPVNFVKFLRFTFFTEHLWTTAFSRFFLDFRLNLNVNPFNKVLLKKK